MDDAGVVAEVVAATSVVLGRRCPDTAVAAAVEAGLIEVADGKLRFRHPLVRSATEQVAAMPDRQCAHAAMASVVEDQPERRAWHRAAALTRPDEAAAADLEAAAVTASRRGGLAVAIRALEGAAQLTPDPASRGARLLRAAELSYEVHGEPGVGRLLDRAEQLPLGADGRARLLWLRASIDKEVGAGGNRIPALLAMAEDTARRGERDLALDLLLRAGFQCWWSDGGPHLRGRLTRVADDLAAHGDDARLLAGLALGAPLERGTIVMGQLRRAPGARAEAADSGLTSLAATAVGAFELATPLLDTSTTALRVQGHLAGFSRRLACLAVTAAQLANLTMATAAAEETERLAADTGQPLIAAIAQSAHAMVAARRGDTQRAEALIAAAEAACTPIGTAAVLCAAQHARGVAALAAGQPAAAFEHLCRVHDPSDPAHHYSSRSFTTADLAEAASRSGRHVAARPIIDGLEALSDRLPVPALLASLRYARALLADDEHAGAVFEAALAEDMRQWPFLRARVQLAYGEWLRRRRRPRDSRVFLRAAREAFEALGTAPWAERAGQELRASGERVRVRTPETRDELTPQELQIARMAAEGFTNKEIGQRLYLSHRTIGSHLHRVFPKLAISSRSQLDAALRRLACETDA